MRTTLTKTHTNIKPKAAYPPASSSFLSVFPLSVVLLSYRRRIGDSTTKKQDKERDRGKQREKGEQRIYTLSDGYYNSRLLKLNKLGNI